MQGYYELLEKLVSFKSISTDAAYKGEINITAKFLAELLKDNGFESEIVEGENMNPVVYGYLHVSDEYKSVLIYGHYDIQPAGEEHKWHNKDPFKVYYDEKKAYARGVVDNKGQLAIHLYSVFKLIKENKLKYNIKFLIEGEEETGGNAIEKTILSNPQKYGADILMVSDGSLPNPNPSLEVSFRGGMNATLTYKALKSNLHSGLFGGAVPNAVYEISKLLAKMYDKNNKVAIPGFYNNVDEIPNEVIEENKKFASNASKLLETTGYKQYLGEPEYEFFSQVGLRPTVQVSGIKAGYVGEGYANIVPGEVEVRFNFRTVASQKTADMQDLFRNFIEENTPKYIDYKLEFVRPYDPIKFYKQDETFISAKKILEEVYEQNLRIINVGGSIPFVATVAENLPSIDILAIPLANNDCNMHGTNENYDLDLIEKGIKFSLKFFSKG